LQHLINAAAADVTDPETGVSVGARARAAMGVAAGNPGADDEDKENAKIAVDPSKDFPIYPLGSGSDYSPFLQHLGLAALNIGFGGEGEVGGVYHSAYDTYEYYSRFADPGFKYAPVLAKTAGRVVLRMADADVPPQRYTDFADTMGRYVESVKKLADNKREAAEMQAKLFAINAFHLADDPTKTSGPPVKLATVPHINFAPLENAADRLKKTAKAYDDALLVKGAGQSERVKAQLFDIGRKAEAALAPDAGLPGRDWYKNLIYAPGRLTGYAPKTLPGVREGIEEEKWDEADKYAVVTAAALNAYSDQLEAGTRLLTGGGTSASAN
jgi:N-acetylated-alpha-linked acidic dipeptidase